MRKRAQQERPTQEKTRIAQEAAASSVNDEANDGKEKKEIAELNIVLKADTLGSLEAIEQQISRLHHDDIRITLVAKGLGNITEADVLRAETANALLMGFNVPAMQAAEDVARGKHLTIKIFTIIYDLIDNVIAEAESRLSPEVLEDLHGELTVLKVFFTKKKEQIFGGRVTKGKMVNPSRLKIIRNGQEVARGKLTELESNKVKSKEVSEGSECGMKYEGPGVVQEGDTVRSFTRKEIKKKLELS